MSFLENVPPVCVVAFVSGSAVALHLIGWAEGRWSLFGGRPRRK